MSRNIRVSEPSAEMQIKIIRAKDAIASQKPRTVRCPYCRHNSIIVFEDTRGHVQTKCKACGRETVFNVLEMRRLRRLQLYYCQYEKESLRLLGAQIVGGDGVDKRIDVLATAICAKMTALELTELDLSYHNIMCRI